MYHVARRCEPYPLRMVELPNKCGRLPPGAGNETSVCTFGICGRAGRRIVDCIGTIDTATVAVVAIGTLRSLNEASITPIPTTAAGAFPLQVSDSVRPPSYVVPQGTELSRTGAPIRLTNYLIHHGEFASGLTRTSVNSNVLGGAIEPAITETAVAKPVPEEGLE